MHFFACEHRRARHFSVKYHPQNSICKVDLPELCAAKFSQSGASAGMRHPTLQDKRDAAKKIGGDDCRM